MAFNGSWYIKVGNYPIPLDYMALGTYKTAPMQRQDNDSYVDANGYLHRNPMPHTRSKLEFETPYLSVRDFRNLVNGIIANYTVAIERKVHLTYYNEEYDRYDEGDFYLPGTVEFLYYNKEIMDKCRIAFIEY